VNIDGDTVEVSLTALCYNLKRVLKMVGVDGLLGAVT
jgi:hypothetical protein